VLVQLNDMSLRGPSGVVWSLDSAQLNANLVTLAANEVMPNHVNDEVDVLVLAVSGSGQVVIDIDIETILIEADSLLSIPQGTARQITADTA